MKPLLTQPLGSVPDPATDLVLPESEHTALLIKAQPLHIQQLIQSSINWFLKEIAFKKGFPLVKDKWPMAINVLRENTDNLGLCEVRDRLYWDMRYANRLASIVSDLASGSSIVTNIISCFNFSQRAGWPHGDRISRELLR